MITIVSKLWRVDFLNAEVTKSKANLEKRFRITVKLLYSVDKDLSYRLILKVRLYQFDKF